MSITFHSEMIVGLNSSWPVYSVLFTVAVCDGFSIWYIHLIQCCVPWILIQKIICAKLALNIYEITLFQNIALL